MTETAVEVAAVTPVLVTPSKTPKKSKAAMASRIVKKLNKPSTHPPVKEMVMAAIMHLKERKGSSLQAVKKYIGTNYECDVLRLNTFILKALKSGVEKGTLIQTKGTGASGSFKLKDKKAPVEKKPNKAVGEKKKAVKKVADEKKVKKSVSKKATGEKKTKGAKAAKVTSKTGTVAKKAAASKQKATKPSKVAAKKPKTPKPKKIAPAKKAAPKKTAAKK
ncbi:histone H1 [Aedes albopictus]|uniref:H15 domain-containing protein n=1 Tax=Aedes albopictus TaxID=7160 RepID=A0ABM2A2F8_AEDAL